MTSSVQYDSPYFELDIPQGTTFSRIVQLFDSLDLVIDLTGATGRMQFRRTIQSPIVLLELSTANGKLLIGTTDGNVQFDLEPADTTALAGDCFFDCMITFATGEIIKAFSGAVSMALAITR